MKNCAAFTLSPQLRAAARDKILVAPKIRRGQAADLPAVSKLLMSARLPTADLTSAHALQTWVLEDRGSIVGIIGLELFGSDGLLRSLAVSPAHGSRGLGAELVGHLEHDARAAGVRQFVLLTETAETFFRGLGYTATDRDQVSEAVKQSAEFHSLCPISAVCMSKALTP
jgi:amino-acid N-acetyltransferase